ncbi:MAG: hypothetical protein ACI8RD_006494, partial [Bacillariaceae sp.]|jgi:hypothetical protein
VLFVRKFLCVKTRAIRIFKFSHVVKQHQTPPACLGFSSYLWHLYNILFTRITVVIFSILIKFFCNESDTDIIKMYKAMLRLFRSTWVAPFLFVLFSANGQLVPDGLLEFFPQDCIDQLESDLLPCAIKNLCFTLLPTDEEIASIPTTDEIESCVDIEASLCPITTRCPACKELADDVFKCVILKSEDISQNITDLVSGCSLSCTPEVAPIAAMIPSPTDVHVPADVPTGAPPTDAPVVPPSEAPIDAPEAEASAVSGTVSTMVSTAGTIAGLTSFFLSL